MTFPGFQERPNLAKRTREPPMHPIQERIMQRVTVDANGCWVWTGPVYTPKNKPYGGVWADGRKRLVHRVLFEVMVGELPPELTLDHKCRNTMCCNPAHLEPVTALENTARAKASRTHCPRGHLYPNTPNRRCLECKRLQQRNRYAKNESRSTQPPRSYQCTPIRAEGQAQGDERGGRQVQSLEAGRAGAHEGQGTPDHLSAG